MVMAVIGMLLVDEVLCSLKPLKSENGRLEVDFKRSRRIFKLSKKDPEGNKKDPEGQ